MIDQVGADGVMHLHLEGEFELGAHAVHARNQDGIEILGFIDGEKRAKSANFAQDTLGERLMSEVLDALLGAIALLNVDAPAPVSDGFGILGHGPSVLRYPP